MAQSAEGGTSAGVPEWTRDESVAAAMNNILITRRCRRGAADDGAEMIFVQFAINNLHSTINNTERAIKMGCCGSANRVQNHPRSASTKYLLPSHNIRTSGVRSTGPTIMIVPFVARSVFTFSIAAPRRQHRPSFTQLQTAPQEPKSPKSPRAWRSCSSLSSLAHSLLAVVTLVAVLCFSARCRRQLFSRQELLVLTMGFSPQLAPL